MLKTAVKALQKGEEPDLSQPLGVTSEINLHVPALLPSDYCSDVRERLTLYKRLANCDADSDLIAMREELIDRFGELPHAAAALVETHRRRLVAKALGIAKMDATEAQITFQFVPNPPIEPMKIIGLIQKNRAYKLAGQDKLKLKRATETLAQRVAAIKEMVKALTG